MQTETWIDIPRYFGYKVSNFGNVRTLKKKRDLILKPFKSNSGYLFVRLFVNRKFYNRYLHSLVAIAFLDHDRILSELIIDHIDGNRSIIQALFFK